MLGPAEFRELVSGRRHGIRATAMRGLLRTAEVPYTLAVAWRNRRYDNSHSAVQRVGVPVISVGNLTLGGTGKTPMVKWLARWLQQREIRVAIVSRGYGASAGNENDEARELRADLPDVPQVQNPDRVAGARQAIDQLHSQLILLDDGFQHRRLARDLDIVLLDALEPFGFDHVFPRGTLREPVAGLRRAHVVCLSRADALDASAREAIRRRAAELAPNAVWCELAHAASGLTTALGAREPLDSLAGRRVAAFCGIGNPDGFRYTLAGTGCEIVAWRAFPDHHAYEQTDLAALRRMAEDSGADILLCTQKDLVKIRTNDLSSVPLFALAIETQFRSGQDALEKTLDCAVRATGATST
jgi:tetraacyldisaccharide 4'-kinase